MSTALQILFPVGRVVMGSLSEAQTKDANNMPLVIKSGPNAGQPTQKYFFAVAIPKTPADNGHWANTSWGSKIWALGHAAWPQGQAGAATFAWKIDDGDSLVPNKKGRVPAKTEGFPGCWVVSFSSTFAVKTYDAKGAVAVDPKSIKLGHYVEVFGTIASNNNLANPGVYINHSMVAHAGFGPEISRGPDPSAVGFGGQALPPGASATPPPSMQPPPAAGAPGVPPPAPTSAPAAVAPPPAAVPPTAVAPHPGFMAPPVPGATVAAPPPPAPAAGPAWKGPPGSTYAAYKAAGWTDEQMRGQGLI
jgi:hypothetical protein